MKNKYVLKSLFALTLLSTSAILNATVVPKEIVSNSTLPEYRKQISALPTSIQKSCNSVKVVSSWDIQALDINKSIASISGMDRKAAIAYFEVAMNKLGFSKKTSQILNIASMNIAQGEFGPTEAEVSLDCLTGQIIFDWMNPEKDRYVGYKKIGWNNVDVSLLDYKENGKGVGITFKNIKGEFAADAPEIDENIKSFLNALKLNTGWNSLDFSISTTSKASLSHVRGSDPVLGDSFDSSTAVLKDGQAIFATPPQGGEAQGLFITKVEIENSGEDMAIYYDTTNDLDGIIAGLKTLKSQVKFNSEKITSSKDLGSWILDFSKDVKNPTFVRSK